MKGQRKEKKSSSAPSIGRSALKSMAIDMEPVAKEKVKRGKLKKGMESESDGEDEEQQNKRGEAVPMTGSSVFMMEDPMSDKKLTKKKGGDEADTENVRLAISEGVELLLDQKPSIRMAATQKLLDQLRGPHGRAAGECLLNSYQNQIQTVVSRLIQRQANTPTDEAPGLLELTCFLAMVLCGFQNEFFKTFESPLKKLVEQPLAGEDVQSQALFTLGFCCYVCRDVEQSEVWEYVEDMLCNGPDDPSELPFIQAARTWVLLASVMDDEHVLERSQEVVYEALSRILAEADDIEGRVTAGEALAFLYEVADRVHGADAEDAAALSPSVCLQPAMADNTLKLLQAAAKESSKKVSKRDKKELRAAFRAVEAFIFEAELPESTVQLQGATIEVASFSQTFLLDNLKRVLGNGFQSALRNFDVIAEVLGVEFLEEDLSPRTRVDKGSKAGKRRDMNRKQDRSYAGDGGGEFMGGEFDEY